MKVHGFHTCPRAGCGRTVPDSLYACPFDWGLLPRKVQRLINRTAGMSVLAAERRYAFEQARLAWTGQTTS